MFYYKLMHWISNIKYYLLISFCPLSEGLQIFLRQHLYVFVFLCVYNNGLLNVAKPSGKHLCRSLFLNKVASLHHANLLKKKKNTVNIVYFFREHLWAIISGFSCVLSAFSSKERVLYSYFLSPFCAYFLSLICFRFRQIYLVF